MFALGKNNFLVAEKKYDKFCFFKDFVMEILYKYVMFLQLFKQIIWDQV